MRRPAIVVFVQAECKLIMDQIFSATECTNKDVRLVAFQCLVRVAELYYQVLDPYIPKAYEVRVFCLLVCFCFCVVGRGVSQDSMLTHWYRLPPTPSLHTQRTLAGITKMEEDVARQALEFWSTLSDVELGIQEQTAEAKENGEELDVTNRGYCARALPMLVKLLTSQMTKQSEVVDETSWDMAMASGTCLGSLAETCGDQILGHVMPFVTSNIASTDWHMREAAIMAFGASLSFTAACICFALVRWQQPLAERV